MDYLRTAYITNMQFDEAGTIIVPVKWYRAASTAIPFPTPHAFVSSRSWTQHQQPTLGLGERWDSPCTYYNGAMPGCFPGLGQRCGTPDWFRFGVPSGTPGLVFADGQVACCPPCPCQPVYSAGVLTENVDQVFPTVQAWPRLTTNRWGSPSEPGHLFFQAGFDGDACLDSGQSVVATLHHLVAPVFTVTMTLSSYDPVTWTGQWTAPSAPAPYNTYILRYQDKPF